jgi:hypothetical protein
VTKKAFRLLVRGADAVYVFGLDGDDDSLLDDDCIFV